MASYKELLLDPRWQRKRLEQLDAAEWRCRVCHEGTRTLHVHHRWYERGKLPWEYPDECFEVLCVDCHDWASEIDEELRVALRSVPTNLKDRVIGYARALASASDSEPMPFGLGDAGIIEGIAAAFSITPDEMNEIAPTSPGEIKWEELYKRLSNRRGWKITRYG